MMKWSMFPLAVACLALCGSCERHRPEALDRLPGHHASHAEAGHEDAHPSAAPAAAPEDAQPRPASSPPKYF